MATTEYILTHKLAKDLLKKSLIYDFKIYENQEHFTTDDINKPYSIIYTKISFKSKNSKMYKAVKSDITNIEGFKEEKETINGETRYILKAQKSLYKLEKYKQKNI
jgi:hypothetical protein